MHPEACILNQGNASWAFEEHAERLASALWLEVRDVPAARNFVLAWDRSEAPLGHSFVPLDAIRFASDKRLQAEGFSRRGVPIPESVLIGDEKDLKRFLALNSSRRWVLKFPTSCGASGHRFVNGDSTIAPDWPTPFVVQEFVEMATPEVCRLYCVAGHLFGWNARRFPKGVKPSPWVAHARGARYVHLGNPPQEALDVATAALVVAGLFDSFGVVDLLRGDGRWLALEVGTDGLHNHVDRDFQNPSLELELDQRLAEAFWSHRPFKPWGGGSWKRRIMPDQIAA